MESADRLKIKTQKLSIKTEIFQFNILSDTDLPKFVNQIDIVIADVPYGKLADWSGLKEGINPVQASLNKIKDRLTKNAVVTIVLNKKQEIKYDGYEKIKSFKSGKRKVVLLERNLAN